jgi:rubrerythrin
MDEAVRKELTDLAQLDRDAVGVYDDALKHVDDDEVRASFKEFRDEHEHHITVITASLKRITGQSPDLSVDFMGRMAEFVTTLRSASGTTGALHAMRTAEQYHNHRYEAALGWDIGDEDLASLIRQFREEEKRHLAFIEQRLGVNAPAQ